MTGGSLKQKFQVSGRKKRKKVKKLFVQSGLAPGMCASTEITAADNASRDIITIATVFDFCTLLFSFLIFPFLPFPSKYNTLSPARTAAKTSPGNTAVHNLLKSLLSC